MKIFSLLFVFSIVVSTNAYSQASLVRNRLQAVALGKVEDVKKELPDILAEFPEDPGVQFLHGVVLEDASRALRIYEKIIKEHPDCEWADDSQWRIVQFYSLRKDTLRARKELKVYREKYPQSEFLLNAAEMVKATVGFMKVDKSSLATSDSKPITSDTRTIAKSSDSVVKLPVKATPSDSKTGTKPAIQDPKATSKQVSPAPKVSPAPTASLEPKASVKSSTDKKNSVKKDVPETKTTAKTTPEVKASTKVEPKNENKEVFSLQVGSYDTREAAENEVKNFKLKRMRASVSEKTIEGATKFAVFIGEYATKESAEKAKELVQKSCSCTPFVVGK
ncbi:MAG: SPOR domain-containing protein [Ignavibacteria bacterium]|nr:SPOR domain-containing protein [Ignavibacteria bacterium]